MFQRLLEAWQAQMAEVSKTPWFQRLQNGEIEIAHYKGLLQETYHHAGLNPQIQAYATMFFRDNPRDMIDLFYKHAISEIGHDLLALNDLKGMGVDTDAVVRSQPLPSTIALNAFVLHQIQFKSPLCYLGYLFHLEFLPTQNGRGYIEQLKKRGVPDKSLTFLEEHSTIDVAHNKLMKKYVDHFVKSEQVFQDILYAMACTCILHGKMVSDAFENGEKLYSV